MITKRQFFKALHPTLFVATTATVALIFGYSAAFAQVKIGTNPTVIGANSNLEVEAANNEKVIVKKDVGTVVIQNTPSGAVTDSVITVNTLTGDVRAIDKVKLRRMLGMSGNGSMARPTAQALAPGIVTVVDFTAILTNELGSIDLANNTFDVKATGTYTFSSTASIRIPGALGTGRANVDLWFQVNRGSGFVYIARAQGEENAGTSDYLTVTVTDTFNVGDQIRLVIQPCGGCLPGDPNFQLNSARFFGVKHF